MSDGTKIEWSEATWNPVTGCTKVSPGCDNCYAETFAERWRGIPGHHFERGFDVTLRPERLGQPLHWTRPRRIFTNSMSDLFHDSVPDDYIAQVFAVMAIARQHTFQVLTKRHGRMRSLLNSDEFVAKVRRGVDAVLVNQEIAAMFGISDTQVRNIGRGHHWAASTEFEWPLPGVWLGVSAENQKWADIRIAALVDTPAATRFVSAEPLLGEIDFRGMCSWLDWVIVGGESGPGARPMDLAWARWIVEQCADADTACFVKQVGSVLGRDWGAGSKGGDWDRWPDDLRVREYPREVIPA